MSIPTMTRMIAFLALGAVAGTASAKDGEVKTNSKGEQVICRKVQTTGSRVDKKVCRTAAEWKMMLEETNTASIKK